MTEMEQTLPNSENGGMTDTHKNMDVNVFNDGQDLKTHNITWKVMTDQSKSSIQTAV